MENLLDALDDARLAMEKSTTASIDIKDILIRLEKEIQHRLQINSNEGASTSMDTITDL